jgi:hypothetical protein
MQTLYVGLAFLMMVVLPFLVSKRSGSEHEGFHPYEPFGTKDL